jgi:hypothetical protein
LPDRRRDQRIDQRHAGRKRKAQIEPPTGRSTVIKEMIVDTQAGNQQKADYKESDFRKKNGTVHAAKEDRMLTTSNFAKTGSALTRLKVPTSRHRA